MNNEKKEKIKNEKVNKYASQLASPDKIKKGEFFDVLDEMLDELIDTIAAEARQEERERILEWIKNAGNNKISMKDPNEPPCPTCKTGFTGTYWISQNNLINHLEDNQ